MPACPLHAARKADRQGIAAELDAIAHWQRDRLILLSIGTAHSLCAFVRFSSGPVCATVGPDVTPPAPRPYGSFHTTRWTQDRQAKAESHDGRRALADLCDVYYEPVVTFLRCELRDADMARDLSHAFFAEMLAGGTIGAAEREQGRFRSYLLGAVKHFLSHQR